MSPLSTFPPEPSALTTLLSNQTTHPTARDALPLEILHNLRHQHSWTDLRLHHPQLPQRPALSAPSNTLSRHPPPPPLQQRNSDPTPHPPPPLDLDSPFSPSRSPLLPPPPPPLPAGFSALSSPPLPSTGATAAAAILQTEPLHPPPVTLLSGIPPRHVYIHPSFQAGLLKAGIPEADVPREREWVLPTSIAEQWTLAKLCTVFDSLPRRAGRRVAPGQGVGSRSSSSSGGGGAGGIVRGGGNSSGLPSPARSSGPLSGDDANVVRHQDSKRVLLAMRAHEGKGGDGTVVYYIVHEGEVKPRQN